MTPYCAEAAAANGAATQRAITSSARERGLRRDGRACGDERRPILGAIAAAPPTVCASVDPRTQSWKEYATSSRHNTGKHENTRCIGGIPAVPTFSTLSQ